MDGQDVRTVSWLLPILVLTAGCVNAGSEKNPNPTISTSGEGPRWTPNHADEWSPVLNLTNCRTAISVVEAPYASVRPLIPPAYTPYQDTPATVLVGLYAKQCAKHALGGLDKGTISVHFAKVAIHDPPENAPPAGGSSYFALEISCSSPELKVTLERAGIPARLANTSLTISEIASGRFHVQSTVAENGLQTYSTEGWTNAPTAQMNGFWRYFFGPSPRTSFFDVSWKGNASIPDGAGTIAARDGSMISQAMGGTMDSAVFANVMTSENALLRVGSSA